MQSPAQWSTVGVMEVGVSQGSESVQHQSVRHADPDEKSDQSRGGKFDRTDASVAHGLCL